MSGKQKWLFAVLIALGILSIAGIAFANTIYLPVIRKDPTATPTFTPTATRTPTVTPTPTAGVEIVDIEYNSDDDSLDEYIEIENNSDDDVDMTDWFIKSYTGPRYDFPDDFTLREDRSVKIWSGTGVDDSNDLYWGRTEPVWPKKGTCALLRDGDLPNDENIIDQYCYDGD
jgi:hypothetical protein